MQSDPPLDLETLINKRLSSAAYSNAEEVLRRALEAQDAEESWTYEERRALSAHIEEGYQQAEPGELIDGPQARREIQAMKQKWREGRLPLDERYVLTPVAKADIFDIWAYIAENNESAADRVEEAIYDACALCCRRAVARPYKARPHAKDS